MESLLGLFYSRIKGSQEDIASEGLVYILQRSQAARQALSKLIKAECGIEVPNLNYSTQNTGDKLERPDISGYDLVGKEVIIIESKFWAALTDNQPIGYLNRLESDTALVFICPTLRVRPVYDEILKRIREADFYFDTKPGQHAIAVNDTKYIIVKTWDEVLGAIRLYLAQANEIALLSDIDQIIGLCHTIDSRSFLPLQTEDLSPAIARRISSYYDLVDKVVQELIKRGVANTTNLKATPQRNGYTRYLNIGIYGVALHLNFDFWARYSDTPFWIVVKEPTSPLWSLSKTMALAIKKVASQLNYKLIEIDYNNWLFALPPTLDKTEDIVINNLADEIIRLIDNIDNQMKISANLSDM